MRTQFLLQCYYGGELLTNTTDPDDSIKSDEFAEMNYCQASPQHLERSIQSDELAEIGYCPATPQHLERSIQSDELAERWYYRAREGDNLLQMIENHERNDPLNAGQVQAIEQMRAVGANLRRIADCMEIEHARVSIALNQSDLLEQGLSDEEIQVIRRIYEENTSITISKIASHLQACLTSKTFRMALGFLSSNTSSVPEELAAACELVRLIYPRVQEAIQSGPIYDELQQFVEDKLDEVLH